MVAAHMWRIDSASHAAQPSAVCAFGAVTYHGTGGNLRLPFCLVFGIHSSFPPLVSPIAQVATVLTFGFSGGAANPRGHFTGAIFAAASILS